MAGGEGTTFGKYHLIKRLAVGGMGEVFLAKLHGPSGFNKLLVIKRILKLHSSNPAFVEMFLSEARITAQLSHANIVQIYEMGEIDHCYYLAMEYVHGKSLRDIIERARKLGEAIPAAHVATMLGQLCMGLSYAHNARNVVGEPIGIIHRDINPQNLLVSYTGDTKLIDFGIAKSELSGVRTESGTIKGKFVYMSPEQTAARELDKRSDIFSVGICLYETLTLFNPFVKSNAVLSMDAIQRLEPAPVAESNRRLAPFDPIISKALAKRPEARYTDCLDLAEELESLLKSGAIDKPPQSLAQYMAELFEEQIEQEKRLLTAALELSDGSAHQGANESSAKAHTANEPTGQPAPAATPAQAAALERGPLLAAFDRDQEQRARLLFFALLSAIIAVTILGSLWVTRTTFARRRLEAARSTIDRLEQPSPGAEEKTLAQPQIELIPQIDQLVISRGSSGAGSGEPASARPAERRPQHPERDNNRPAPAAASPSSSSRMLRISTTPSVRITRDDKPTSSTIKLSSASGEIIIGTGDDPANDPFAVKLAYRVEGDAITYIFESEPWAIVSRSGIGLGRVPVTYTEPAGSTAYELVNPKDSRRLKLNVRFTP